MQKNLRMQKVKQNAAVEEGVRFRRIEGLFHAQILCLALLPATFPPSEFQVIKLPTDKQLAKFDPELKCELACFSKRVVCLMCCEPTEHHLTQFIYINSKSMITNYKRHIVYLIRRSIAGPCGELALSSHHSSMFLNLFQGNLQQ